LLAPDLKLRAESRAQPPACCDAAAVCTHACAAPATSAGHAAAPPALPAVTVPGLRGTCSAARSHAASPCRAPAALRAQGCAGCARPHAPWHAAPVAGVALQPTVAPRFSPAGFVKVRGPAAHRTPSPTPAAASSTSSASSASPRRGRSWGMEAQL
jgi:hypothetical protein